MSFAISKLTNDGLGIVASATATNTVTLDRIICFTNYHSNAATIDLETILAWTDIIDSSVLTCSFSSVGADPDNELAARFVMDISRLSNGTSSIKTIIVTAHTTDDQTERTLYALSNSGTAISVVRNAYANYVTQIAVSFGFSESSYVTTGSSTPNYLLASEVNRFVTTHKSGDGTSGDAQVIYGKKTFMNDVVLDGDGPSGHLQICYDGDPYATIFSYYDVDHGGNSANLCIDLNELGMQTLNNRVFEIKCSSLNKSVCEFQYDENIEDLQYPVTFKTGNISCQTVYSEILITDYISTQSSYLNIDATITPSSNAKQIGINTNRWIGYFSNLYARETHSDKIFGQIGDDGNGSTIHARAIFPSSSNTWTNVGSLNPMNDNISLGYAQNYGSQGLRKFKELNVVTANATTVNATTVNATTVNATNLNGCIPTPSIVDASPSLPIGAFILALTPQGESHSTGETVLYQSGQLYALKINNGGTTQTDTSFYLPSGRYRFCSAVGSSGQNFALLQYLGGGL